VCLPKQPIQFVLPYFPPLIVNCLRFARDPRQRKSDRFRGSDLGVFLLPYASHCALFAQGTTIERLNGKRPAESRQPLAFYFPAAAS
jgi:hypothetical protein